MEIHVLPDFTIWDALGSMAAALMYIALFSLVKEPHRQRINAIIIAGAGAVYWAGGLGLWEYAFSAVMLGVAFVSLSRYYFIGIGWLLHTTWDILHHLNGNPIIPFSPTSSAGCAFFDAVLAVWFFCNAPSIFKLLSHKTPNNQSHV